MDFIAKLKSKYPWLSVEECSEIVCKAKMFYYGIKYPCEPLLSENDRPIIGFFAQNWMLSACDEIVERLGFNSATGYRENGVNWTFDGAQLSERLVSLIKPTVGVIK
jgi:hypothetical protein